jgi:hypothetical protein
MRGRKGCMRVFGQRVNAQLQVRAQGCDIRPLSLESRYVGQEALIVLPYAVLLCDSQHAFTQLLCPVRPPPPPAASLTGD